MEQIEFKAKRLHIPFGVPELSGYLVSPMSDKANNGFNVNTEKVNGAALDLNQENALARAISESIERCCFMNFEEDKFYYGYYDRNVYINPKEFILYSQDQYFRRKFSYVRPEILYVYEWVKAESLLDGTIKYLPAELIVPVDKVGKIDGCTSTGAAVAKNEIHSLENGLCEVIERDTTMCSWLLKKGWFCLESSQLFATKKIAELFALVQNVGMNIEVYFAVNDMNIITVISRLYSTDNQYNAYGSCCKLDIELAIQRSIEESVMILRTQKILLKKNYVGDKSVASLMNHIMVPYNRYFRNYNSWFVGKTTVLSSGAYQRLTENHPKTFKECINRLVSHGYEPLRVNILHTKFSDSGYYANKVVVPGMHPLEVNHSQLHRDYRRLKIYSGGILNSSEINFLPHPFG